MLPKSFSSQPRSCLLRPSQLALLAAGRLLGCSLSSEASWLFQRGRARQGAASRLAVWLARDGQCSAELIMPASESTFQCGLHSMGGSVDLPGRVRRKAHAKSCYLMRLRTCHPLCTDNLIQIQKFCKAPAQKTTTFSLHRSAIINNEQQQHLRYPLNIQ